MKQRVLIAAIVLLIGSMFVLAPATQAQAPASATPTSSTDQERLNGAYQVATDAASSATGALGIIDNADNNVRTANLLLAIARGAFVIAIGVVGLIGYVGFRSSWQSVVQVRQELAQARIDLADLRTGVKEQSKEIRDHARNAIEALSLMQLGEQLVDRRNLKAALEMYRRAIALDPTNEVAHYFLGELYVLDKQLDKGIEELKVTLAVRDDYAPAEAAIGYALRVQAEQTSRQDEREILYAQAESRLLRALQLDPLVLDVHRESVHGILGGLYKRQGRIDQAIHRYREALKVTPHTSYPVNNLAVLHFMQGNLKDALPRYQQTEARAAKILHDNPNDYWSRLDHLAALLAQNRTDEAMLDLDAVLAQVKTPSPLESALGDLIRMKNAPQPPKGIDTVVSRMQAAIKRMSRHT